MKTHRTGDGERTLAVFIDFENVGLGFGGRRDRFSIEKVLERLVEKGKIVAKKAYADWSRFGPYAASLHAAAVELVEIPKRNQTGKNSADIRMCVDAMDLAYSKDHIDTFVIVSGDSDFSPLVSKLKELGKHVIGLGLADATSNLLRDNCDEFIYYEDLDRAPVALPAMTAEITENKQKAFALALDALLALKRENKEVIYSSMVKDTIKRKKPGFNEEYHGYRTFTDLLLDAQRHGLMEVEKSKVGGGYVVTRFSAEGKPAASAAPVPAPVPTPNAPLPSRSAAARPVEPPPPPAPPRREPPPRPERAPEPPPRPVRVAAPPEQARPSRPPERETGRPPLGRALFEDDIDFGDDDIPSYRPRKAEPAKPAAPPAKPAPPAPQAARRSEPPAKPAPQRRPAARPTPKPPAGDDDFGSGLD